MYGYTRVQVWLKITYNLHINHKRVQRLMSELRIRSHRYQANKKKCPLK
ncbi:hypothetical protein CO726_29330 [Bacillus fungorum]|uniref:HTH-like domain-containing protein n=1 Tax=Bacillus fungorum TaxID=2039284 RepID=A0A2G6Q6B6_9BACI|nr:hypothetical protein CO726_29330 [Bacillus fungorum]